MTREAYNPRRGDVKIELAGATLHLRPSFNAIVEIEEHYGKPVFDVAREFCEGKRAGARDILFLVEAGLRGAAAAPPEDLPERIAEAGLAKFVPPLGQFLAHACGIEQA